MQGPTTTAGLGSGLGGRSGRYIHRLLAEDPDATQAAQRTASFDAVQQLALQQRHVQQQWTQAKICAARADNETANQSNASGASSASTAARRLAEEASAQGQASDLPED
jgi:hypothetical protein